MTCFISVEVTTHTEGCRSVEYHLFSDERGDMYDAASAATPHYLS
jgi:hypothetical protein